MIALLGIDCATNPKKTGLALGELRGEVVHILRCATGTRDETPAMIATNWLADYEEELIALDAPLGWPQKLGVCLSAHRAGLPVQAPAVGGPTLPAYDRCGDQTTLEETAA